MDRGAWRATVRGVAMSWTRLKPHRTNTRGAETRMGHTGKGEAAAARTSAYLSPGA